MTSEDKAIGCGIVGCVFLLFVVMPIGCTVGQHVNYSDGQREGTLQKLTNKGMIWRTWEGELAVEGMKISGNKDGMSGGNVFSFTVDDPAVVEAMRSAVGHKVRLHYREALTHVPWNGDTSYRITRAEVLGQKTALTD